MARRSRFFLPGQPAHLIQRGNNRSSTFYSEEDCHFYLDALSIASQQYDCAIHAYVLMTNHVHILATPETDVGLSQMMQSVGRRYVRYINQTYQRTGTLWEGRFKASLVQDSHYLLTCSRYIELNPVRAGMVRHPADYRWSSYRHNALGEEGGLIQPHPVYLGLGRTNADRRQNYQALFHSRIDKSQLDEMRRVINNESLFGDVKFKKEIERILRRKVEPYNHGGDRKSKHFQRTRKQF